MRITKNRTRQHGLAIIEFTIVLPFLLLAALAVAEAGRAMYQYNTLTKSVHNGVRYLSDKALDPSGQLDDTSPYFDGLRSETIDLVIYGDINGSTNGATRLLPINQDIGKGVEVTAEAFPLLMEGDPPGVVDNHVRVTGTYTFTPLFSLGGLSYQRVIPDFSVSAVERALRI